MFFTKAGRVIAWLCFVGGLLHYGYLIVLAGQNYPPSPNDPIWAMIFAATPKDQNLIAFGIVLGIFAEISKSLATLAAPKHSPESDEPQR